ncbi:hypothetical protein NFI96_015288 [Prochilodus magdalenae]|nr:hypothetical protein NFI96_015288 [Prochilodus magdalenae]
MNFKVGVTLLFLCGLIIFHIGERLPKPGLNFTCKKDLANLKCEVKENNGLSFIWYQNGKQIREDKNILIGQKDDSYECALEKPVKSYKSAEVKTDCVKRAQGDKLFGFDFWIMVGILAGGGGLVLLLMIVLVTCACQSCKRREKHLRDEEELRLNFHTPPQRSKNTARGQPAPPVPQEDPEVSNYEVDEPPPKAQSKVKNQPRIRPPPPPIDEDEQPPPLPQPRSKVPHNKKNQGPLYMQP